MIGTNLTEMLPCALAAAYYRMRIYVNNSCRAQLDEIDSKSLVCVSRNCHWHYIYYRFSCTEFISVNNFISQSFVNVDNCKREWWLIILNSACMLFIVDLHAETLTLVGTLLKIVTNETIVKSFQYLLSVKLMAV